MAKFAGNLVRKQLVIYLLVWHDVCFQVWVVSHGRVLFCVAELMQGCHRSWSNHYHQLIASIIQTPINKAICKKDWIQKHRASEVFDHTICSSFDRCWTSAKPVFPCADVKSILRVNYRILFKYEFQTPLSQLRVLVSPSQSYGWCLRDSTNSSIEFCTKEKRPVEKWLGRDSILHSTQEQKRIDQEKDEKGSQKSRTTHGSFFWQNYFKP